ncbi:MAG: DUF1656 domain-containing protein [Acetobacter aceti]|jgi:hypothetical protein|uniref:DUF1656 domain-containing protein n=1 Tax=Acetobacter aceti TaxID=435 RepID=A0A1U9KFI6_ACEAC|nr:MULTISPECIES: DUF1656 domain-containing protein [Acetobacter]AQS84487.1 hypothetical protein A0U92_06520 [Acetobacter aceti]MCH4090128.1 DUF1656 domain-containing protein [Acetobacter sp.]MCI1298824.1 DUF1656 domain-containing protein [Acetobacter sp.]MCI1314843.1 DUF1656 domain-containing protein [Acetobacter sp.]
MNAPLQSVINIGGLLVSSFLVHVGLGLLTMVILKPILTRTRLDRFMWNVPLAEFGMLIIFTGIYTILL